jgi:group I intron endonuclease
MTGARICQREAVDKGEDMSVIVYRLRNKIDGKVYIGQTVNLKRRRAEHFSHASGGEKHPLYDAIRKYGKKNFQLDVLCSCFDVYEADIIEKSMIAYYHSRDRRFGYNLCRGGQAFTTLGLHWKLSKETRRRQSKAQLGNKKALGYKWSKESRRKMSKRQRENPNNPDFAAGRIWLGRHHSEKTKRKLSKINKGHPGPVISIEGRQRCREAQLRRWEKYRAEQKLLGGAS